MKSSNDYIKLSKEYAENRLKRFKEKFGNDFINCDDRLAIYLLSEGYLDGRIAGEFDIYESQHKVQKYLNYLTTSGWSELIDERWKDEVNEQLKNAFPDITEDELNEVNKLVFV